MKIRDIQGQRVAVQVARCSYRIHSFCAWSDEKNTIRLTIEKTKRKKTKLRKIDISCLQ